MPPLSSFLYYYWGKPGSKFVSWSLWFLRMSKFLIWIMILNLSESILTDFLEKPPYPTRVTIYLLIGESFIFIYFYFVFIIICNSIVYKFLLNGWIISFPLSSKWVKCGLINSCGLVYYETLSILGNNNDDSS